MADQLTNHDDRTAVSGGPPAAGTTAAADPPWADDTVTVAAAPRVRLAAPSFRAVVRMILIFSVCGICLYLLWRVRGVVQLVAISVFFSLALIPMVDAVCNVTHARRAPVILGIYLVLIAAVAVIGYVVIPSLVKEVHQLSRDAPRYAADLRRNATFRRYDDRYHITLKLVNDAQRLPQLLRRLAGPLTDVTVRAFGFIGELVTVLAMAFLLTLHGRRYVEMGLSLTGSERERYRTVLIDIKNAVAGYIVGNLAISGLATLATWIALSLLGVPYSLSLGFVVGFFDLIPLIGATLGAIVVVLATLTVDFPTATLVWVGFIVVWQRFEDYVVQPLVYRRSVNVNPLVTIVSVLAGASLLGILGAVLAIPTAAAIQILLHDWWANHRHSEAHRGAARPGTESGHRTRASATG